MNRKSSIILVVIFINIFLITLFSYSYASMYISLTNTPTKTTKLIERTKENETLEKNEEDKDIEVILTAVGDCTIGYDDNFGYTKSFNEVVEQKGYDFIFNNVKYIFENDDITIANLEGTFTDSTIKREKAFNFKAPKDYVSILKNGSIEVVNIANNHIYDYNEIGYTDTINTLNSANIEYFGFDNYYVYNKFDINIGFAGIYCIEDKSCISKIDSAISTLKSKDADTIILSFHWGIEKSYKQSSIQTYLAHYAIDNGAELILGHHPHVLQGIEFYKDKYIVYSLGNFSFGGNKNPSDKDSMIFQIKFKYLNKSLKESRVNIIPVSISSEKNINNYQPTPLSGEEYNRVLKKIQENSIGISFS